LANPGFTLAEDAALKTRISTLSVSDDKSAERVLPVFFRHPESVTEKSYPFATIELLDIRHATERQHSHKMWTYAEGNDDLTDLTYYPDEMDEAALAALAPTDGFLKTAQFVPVDLVYQVSTYTRSQRHDRQLTALMLRRVFPFQGRSWIPVPEDDTMRRVTLTNWASSDLLDQESGYKKRIFRKVYTLTMNAEIPSTDFISSTRVLTVEGEINGHTDSLSNDPDLTEEF